VDALLAAYVMYHTLLHEKAPARYLLKHWFIVQAMQSGVSAANVMYAYEMSYQSVFGD
jgi:hypothetical protein